jgi:hypothetical protein
VTEELPHRDDSGRIQPIRGLVEHEKPRIVQERGGDPQALLHAVGETRYRIRRPLAQPDQLEKLVDPSAGHLRPGGTESVQIRSGRQVGVEGRRLDECADLEEELAAVPIEWLPQDLDPATVGVKQTGEEPHGRRLAGTVRTQEPVHDARGHGQVQPIERQAGAVALAEAPHDHSVVLLVAHRVHRGHHPASSMCPLSRSTGPGARQAQRAASGIRLKPA